MSSQKCYMCGKEVEKVGSFAYGEHRICFECKENEDLIQWEMKRQQETADKYNFETNHKWRRNDNAWR